MFLLIGGEGQAAIQWMSAGAWIQTAREYGALLFQLEHRFYGESQPLRYGKLTIAIQTVCTNGKKI